MSEPAPTPTSAASASARSSRRPSTGRRVAVAAGAVVLTLGAATAAFALNFRAVDEEQPSDVGSLIVATSLPEAVAATTPVPSTDTAPVAPPTTIETVIITVPADELPVADDPVPAGGESVERESVERESEEHESVERESEEHESEEQEDGSEDDD